MTSRYARWLAEGKKVKNKPTKKIVKTQKKLCEEKMTDDITVDDIQIGHTADVRWKKEIFGKSRFLEKFEIMSREMQRSAIIRPC